MRRRTILGGAAAVLGAAALLVVGTSRHGAPATAGARAGGGSPAAAFETSFASGVSTEGTSAQLVTRLQAKLRLNPEDAEALASLGLAYQQRARETADPTYYTKSAGALAAASKLAPHDLTATSGLASLALSRHRFREALRLGLEAHTLGPRLASPYAIVGDAQIELGRYRSAFRTFDMLAGLKPGVAAYARISYARELLGRTAGAIAAMRMAVDAATAQPEPTAWTRWQLGKLYWSVGDVAAAATEYRAALAAFPGYVYALDALAQVESARGRLRAAIALERRAVEKIPLPQFVSSLGDLYAAAGATRLAARQYGLMDVIRRLLIANGVKTDLETALFRVDHGIAPAQTLALARLAQRERPSIDGDDVLAWALARNEHCGEALRYSRLSLRLGTKDALKDFHRGMIERCLGRQANAAAWFARALALNPHFSLLWAPVAKAGLR
jgi:tetratricopeptide (TPR) repeat protein